MPPAPKTHFARSAAENRISATGSLTELEEAIVAMTIDQPAWGQHPFRPFPLSSMPSHFPHLTSHLQVRPYTTRARARIEVTMPSTRSGISNF